MLTKCEIFCSLSFLINWEIPRNLAHFKKFNWRIERVVFELSSFDWDLSKIECLPFSKCQLCATSKYRRSKMNFSCILVWPWWQIVVGQIVWHGFFHSLNMSRNVLLLYATISVRIFVDDYQLCAIKIVYRLQTNRSACRRTCVYACKHTINACSTS